jgi:hypothetical protein
VSSPLNTNCLKGRDVALLLIVTLVMDVILVSMQPVPGYMDASYYYATGIQLAEGNGFSEPFLWNYLDNPQSIPHPSHSYWYPLASLVAAFGMALTGKTDFTSARIGFFLIALLFPVVVANLALQFSAKRNLALVSGFLAIFCGYYLPFVVTTDNYAIYLLIGATYFLSLNKITIPRAFLLGLMAGLLNLARADGLLWLPLTLISVTFLSYQSEEGKHIGNAFPWRENLGVIGGYIFGFGFWITRNLVVYGSLTSPGSSHVLWMTEYNQLFSLTPNIFTFQTWLAQGWKEIFLERLQALWVNLGTGMMAQGFIFLFPFIVVGGWQKKSLFPVRLAVLGWLILLVGESFLFPYASVRGGFFHAGAVFQPVWLALAPMGMDKVMEFILRSRFARMSKSFIQLISVIAVFTVTILLVKIRVFDSGWNEGEYRYMMAEEIILSQGAEEVDVVVTVNPPAYNAMTGRSAIVIPDGGIDMLLIAASQFAADYVIIEKDRSPSIYQYLTDDSISHPEFIDIGGFEGVRIYAIAITR